METGPENDLSFTAMRFLDTHKRPEVLLKDELSNWRRGKFYRNGHCDIHRMLPETLSFEVSGPEARILEFSQLLVSSSSAVVSSHVTPFYSNTFKKISSAQRIWPLEQPNFVLGGA